MRQKGATFLSVLFLALAASGISFGNEPTAGMVIVDRSLAVTHFLNDEKVVAAIAKLESDGYRQLSVEAVPLEFNYTEEGGQTTFLVTSWHGKSEASGRGWDSKFVSATVLDARLGLGIVDCKILDSEKLATAVKKLP